MILVMLTGNDKYLQVLVSEYPKREEIFNNSNGGGSQRAAPS
jgi:hypothetical protein